MTGRIRTVMLLAAATAMLAGCAHRGSAGEAPAPWDLRGTIVAVATDQVRIRHKSGQVVELTVDDQTAIVGAEGQTTRSVLTSGRRVVVHVEPLTNGHARAATIRVYM